MMIDNEVSQLVLSYIWKNLLYAEQQLENMVFLNSRTRIIQAIVDLADIHGQRIWYETFINIPLTQDDIAELSLTSRQTVTTLFSELKRSNIIHVAGRGKILIRDLKSFRNLEF
jgi:CRP/FNR family transcriptional regulator